MPLVIIAVIGALFASLGYFGGQDMMLIPATGPAAPARQGIAAVVISGDMGLGIGMGGQIAGRLAAAGIPVIGVNSLSFFRHRRTPVEVAVLVDAVTRRALALDHVTRVVVIGQSFGADVLPTGLASLSPMLRAHIAFVGLVVPATTLTLRASPSEIFSWREPEHPALPFAQQLTWAPGICISGSEEKHSLCPELTQANITHVVLPGGHAMHRDSAAVFRALIAGIDTASAAETN